MATHPPTRGSHLLSADRAFVTGAGLVARLFAPGFRKIVDRIDAGLRWGSLDLVLPGGERRRLGGRAPGPDAQVELLSWRALWRLISSGSVGWYAGWAAGEWTSPDPAALFELFVRNRASLGEAGRARGIGRRLNRAIHALRRNDREGARRNIAFHYDLGNDFYAAWLDATMTYSSAVFAEPITRAEPLEDAQRRKVRLLLDRLALEPGDRLLEIGCGWGGLMEIAAREYGARVTGITLSAEQKAFAERRLAAAGLAERCEILLCDYRDIPDMFEGVVSVEMVEAVGRRYWPAYLDAIAGNLAPGGRAALQFIAMDEAIFESYARNADFIQAYIFPGGLLISEPRFAALAAAAGLGWNDRVCYGHHYVETLQRWRKSFDTAIARQALPDGFDQRFHDLWRYYLMYCEGGFRGGGIDVVQVTLTKTA